MKKTLSLLLTLLFLLNPVLGWATDYTQDVNCVGAWTLEEGTGTNTDDSATTNKDLTLIGGTSWLDESPKAYSTHSVACDGINGKIQDDTGIADNLSPFTWVVWVKWDVLDNKCFMSKTSLFDYEKQLFNRSTGIVAAYFNGSTPLNYESVTSTIATGNWYHIAFVMNSNLTAKIYVNGSEVSYSVTTQGSSLADDSDGYFLLGGRAYVADPSYSDVNVDEPGIFSRALSSTEINDIMDNGLAGSAPPAARRMWVFN